MGDQPAYGTSCHAAWMAPSPAVDCARATIDYAAGSSHRGDSRARGVPDRAVISGESRSLTDTPHRR
jgi:hypothetical protein